MLFTYDAIHNVIRLAYMVRGGINDMHDDIHVRLIQLKQLNDIHAMLFTVKL